MAFKIQCEPIWTNDTLFYTTTIDPLWNICSINFHIAPDGFAFIGGGFQHKYGVLPIKLYCQYISNSDNYGLFMNWNIWREILKFARGFPFQYNLDFHDSNYELGVMTWFMEIYKHIWIFEHHYTCVPQKSTLQLWICTIHIWTSTNQLSVSAHPEQYKNQLWEPMTMANMLVKLFRSWACWLPSLELHHNSYFGMRQTYSKIEVIHSKINFVELNIVMSRIDEMFL